MGDAPLASCEGGDPARTPRRAFRRRNEEIVGLLHDEAHTQTERFWRMNELMDEEARMLRACFDGHSKGQVACCLFLMYGHGLIERPPS